MIDPDRSVEASGARPAGDGERAMPDADAPRIKARTLMQGRREVTILHAGERYRLRITANDKLILTK